MKFYHIDGSFMPAKNFLQDEYILYPNYFGICSKNVLELCKKYKNLIVDNAHAYYMEPCGLASIYSYRKFFPVRDGAELAVGFDINIDLQKSDYFYTAVPSKYDETVENELRLDDEEPMFISDCTRDIMDNINFDDEKSRRLKAFNCWHEKLKDTNELNIKLDKCDVPFVYPYLSKVDYDFKDKLIYRYWDALPESFPEYKYYRYLKPVPLD